VAKDLGVFVKKLTSISLWDQGFE